MMDKAQFRMLYERFFPELCLFLGNFTSDRDLVKDIVQNIFCKLLDEDIGQIRNIRGWLYYCARNAMFNHLRDNSNKQRLLLDAALQIPSMTEDLESDAGEERLSSVNRAIETLPAECRKIFLIAKREGKSYKEIALEKSISVKTVEAQMGIALRRIREFCKEEKNQGKSSVR